MSAAHLALIKKFERRSTQRSFYEKERRSHKRSIIINCAHFRAHICSQMKNMSAYFPIFATIRKKSEKIQQV